MQQGDFLQQGEKKQGLLMLAGEKLELFNPVCSPKALQGGFQQTEETPMCLQSATTAG